MSQVTASDLVGFVESMGMSELKLYVRRMGIREHEGKNMISYNTEEDYRQLILLYLGYNLHPRTIVINNASDWQSFIESADNLFAVYKRELYVKMNDFKRVVSTFAGARTVTNNQTTIGEIPVEYTALFVCVSPPATPDASVYNLFVRGRLIEGSNNEAWRWSYVKLPSYNYITAVTLDPAFSIPNYSTWVAEHANESISFVPIYM